MVTLETSTSTNTIEKLVDIVVSLADYTHSVERCREIPAFLAMALGLESTTLSVVRQSPDDLEPHFLFCGSSHRGCVEPEERALKEQALSIHRQARASIQDDASRVHVVDLQQSGEWHGNGDTMQLPGFHPTHIFARMIDPTHFMLLTLTAPCENSAEDRDRPGELLIIAQELSKQLHCLISWQNSPVTLGAPFDSLTKREWAVLHSLNTEASEKQIAHRLGQRPHTLHSHIKSIYHKVGVQGRLPLLQRLQSALRQMRIAAHNFQAPVPNSPQEEIVE